MAILKVARLGHPVLRQKCSPIDPEKIPGPEVQGLIRDMLQTMVEYNGVGLAAPQVHQPVRLRHILLYHGTKDEMALVELARSFDQLLTEHEVDHEYVEVESGHCNYDMTPILQYMSDHLLAEQP